MLTASEKVSESKMVVTLRLVGKDRENPTSPGGVESLVKWFTCKGLLLTILVMALLLVSTRKRLVILMKVVAFESARGIRV